MSSAAVGESTLKLALVQLEVGAQKSSNLERAGSLVRAAANNGAKLVTLPECFNSPYGVKYFQEYAESIPDGESSKFLSGLAKECEVFLVGGSIPEKHKGKLYNTCTVYGPDGKLLGKYCKMHLSDINIPGGIQLQESKAFSPGNEFFSFTAGDVKVGIGICYDMRFHELASYYNQNGCQLILYPGAFNMVTGPLHWELLARGRAVDNQCYVAAIGQARDQQADYVAYGHSLLVDPWGTVVGGAGAAEEVVYGEVDLDQVEKVRTNIPMSLHELLLA